MRPIPLMAIVPMRPPMGPVHIDPDDARERIHRELLKPEYDDGDGFIPWLLKQIETWLGDMTHRATGNSTTATVLAIVLALLLVVVGFLVLRRTGMLRGSSTLRAGVSLAADPELSGQQLREQARDAASRSRSGDAVVLAMRALVRDLEERTLLDVTAGMTAHEAARAAAIPFPDLRTRLALAADAFDTAAYSRRAPSAKQVEDILRLCEYVAQAAPELGARHPLPEAAVR